MAHEREELVTQSGIHTDVNTINWAGEKLVVYGHGAISEFYSSSKPVTAQWPLEQQLVEYPDIFMQRGANPLMGPWAGRVGLEDGDQLPPRVAQPGPVDIHGVFAGMPWETVDINDNEHSVTMSLPSSRWKGELKTYYYFAGWGGVPDSQQRRSLDRLIRATKRRYSQNQGILTSLDELESLLSKPVIPEQLGRLDLLVGNLVDYAYPGEANLVRKTTLTKTDDAITEFLDEVWIQNSLSSKEDYRGAEGFHTYFNAFLHEIVVPEGFWGGPVPVDYDENLPDVQVRILDQRQRLGRIVILFPMDELADPAANQIIYKDPQTPNVSNTALECWRQVGDDRHYPEIARIVKPGEQSKIGIKVVVIQGENIP